MIMAWTNMIEMEMEKTDRYILKVSLIVLDDGFDMRDKGQWEN